MKLIDAGRDRGKGARENERATEGEGQGYVGSTAMLRRARNNEVGLSARHDFTRAGCLPTRESWSYYYVHTR